MTESRRYTVQPRGESRRQPEYQGSADGWLHAIDSRQAVMRERLVTLAKINSGSDNVVGVNRVGEYMAGYFAELGVDVDRHALQPVTQVNDDGEVTPRPLGDAFVFSQRPQAPVQVLLVGHLDTVFAVDHPFQSVREIAGNRLNGPGVADLKGGLIVMHTALAALENSPWREHIGWRVILNPDEEIGSPGSAPLLIQAAQQANAGLVFEPSMPDGSLAGARKGSGNFALVFHGRAAHAGREHHLGRNALRALADCLAAIDVLNGEREGVTINPAFVHGGGANNVVPDRGLLRFNIRIERGEDEAWFQHQLDAILADINAREGITVECHGGFGRKPKILDARQQQLFNLVADCGRELGQDIVWYPTGGCCDGNNLAAAGLANVDTLGVIGGAIHSSDEYVELDSLVPRAKLTALLLARLAADA